MTRSGHNVIMKRVRLSGRRANIAVLKANLSRYLRKVQAGEELIVMDRATAIAKVIPYRIPKDDFVVIPAKKPFRQFWDRPPVNLRKRVSLRTILRVLREDRDDRDRLLDSILMHR